MIEPPRLVVRTRPMTPLEEPLVQTAPAAPLVWSRRGDALIGMGRVAVLTEAGSDRAERLAARWRALTANASVDDQVQLPGTGLVAFGALAFDDRSAHPSTLTVPETIFGRRGADAWVTTVTLVDAAEHTAPAAAQPYGPAWSATLGPGSLDAAGYIAAVEQGLHRIAAGDLAKIVLARDLRGTAPADADLRRLVRALGTGYPDCWTFAVDGIIGASPETLVTVDAGTVTARVLAGTTARGADADLDTAAAVALSTSAKDLDEHGYAVRSLVAALSPHTASLAVSDEPFTLKLPNVWHLATDVEGTLAAASSSLDLVSALHPTAAVAGTPTSAAVDAIASLEPFDRGRYAGPVGWIDAAGNGEWAIALRCVQVSATGRDLALTAHAGAGIVAGSDPERELLETRVKFRPIVEALA